MKDCKNFEHGASKEEFDKLADFMEQNNFSCSDFLACVCAYFNGKEFREVYNSDIKEILAEVPTFEEWQTNQKWIKYLEEKIKIYERKDKQATETSIAYNELAEENEELKLLVAEALSHFKASFPILYRDWIDKADKFLGEDK